MADNFHKVIDHLIIAEGGYVNHIADTGGHTIYGVTKKNWDRYKGFKTSLADFKRLTPSDVKKFYLDEYWNRCNCDALPDGVDYAVFDWAVHAGPYHPCVAIQKIVGTLPDGFIGSITLNALNEYIRDFDNDQIAYQEVIDCVFQKRREKLNGVNEIKKQYFMKGWDNRIKEAKRKCYEMINLIYFDNRKPLEESRTIKTSKKGIVSSLGVAGAVSTQITLPDINTIASDFSTINGIANGINGLFKYGIYIGLAIIIGYFAFQMLYRRDDHFTEERK